MGWQAGRLKCGNPGLALLLILPRPAFLGLNFSTCEADLVCEDPKDLLQCTLPTPPLLA